MSRCLKLTFRHPDPWSTFQQLLKDAAMEPVAAQGPDNWKRILADDIALWGPLVKGLGLKID